MAPETVVGLWDGTLLILPSKGQTMPWRTFWLIRNKVKKFWKIKLSGKSYTVVAGKKGTAGKTTTKTFATNEKAEKAYLLAISLTFGKGYREGDEEPTNIWNAVWEGNASVVRQLLAAAPGLCNERGPEGITPLHVAVEDGNCAMAKLLLEAGADINARGGEENATPFELAIREFSTLIKGDVQMVELLLQYHPDLTLVDRLGETLLYRVTTDKDLAALAQKHGIPPEPDLAVIETLKEKGMAYARKQLEANPHLFRNPRIGELLSFAQGGGERVYQFLKFLLDNGVNPNVTVNGQPAIELAVHYARDPRNVRLLLERGVDLQRLPKGGRDLLLDALYLNKGKEIIDLLIRYGAKQDLLVLWRREGAKKASAEILRNPARLRDLEAPIEFMNEVIKHGDDKVVELMLQQGVDPNAHGTDQDAPLRVAAGNANLKLVRLLLEHGANPVPQDGQPEIPLIYGGFQEKKAQDVKAIADLLLAKGALTWPQWQEDWEKRIEAALARQERRKKKKQKSAGEQRR
jgi:ankyrin repeat protein